MLYLSRLFDNFLFPDIDFCCGYKSNMKIEDGKLTLSVSLPSDVNLDEMKAEIKDGMLFLEAPMKKMEQKQIELKKEEKI